MQDPVKSIVEAYIGEYASGKSENAINRALQLAAANEKVTLADLDLVEPCYTLRSLQDDLKKQGVDVLAWTTSQTFGLGEAGQILHPACRWALKRPGHVILDIGYGSHGANILNLLEGADCDPDLRVILVANFSRPLTSDLQRFLAYAQGIGRVDALLANTHLGNETTPKVVLDGIEKTVRAAKELKVTVDAFSVTEEFRQKYPDFNYKELPMRVLKRVMPQGFW